MSDELLARLDTVRRSFSEALVIGDPTIASALRTRGLSAVTCDAAPGSIDVQCDEDRLPFADRSFDLVISLGVLDTVNDVPGALVLTRRILRPGGLFLGAMVGAGSLATLRRCIPATAPRFHPQIDVRAAGDLLGRAGFALPVADSDIVTARYADLNVLVQDLRANGLRNCLAARSTLPRASLDQAQERFRQAGGGQKTAETINLIFMTGWAPEGSRVERF